MRTIVLLVLGALIGVATLGAVWSATDGDVTLRVTVLPHEDGRVEVGLQHLNAEGEWIDAEEARFRFLAPDAEPGIRLHSSDIVVPVETPAESVAGAYYDYLHSEGSRIADSFPTEPAEEGAVPATTMLCIIDLRDEGLGGLCDGLETTYEGTVERVENENSEQLRQYFDERFQNGDDIAGAFATSPRITEIIANAMRANDFFVPLSYWMELINPLLPASDSLYCVIGHGGRDVDFFWGLSGEAQQSALAGLDVQLRSESFTEIEDQVAAVRQCLDDGAAAVATTLSNPVAMQPVIDELRVADIPVISYNSGAEEGDEISTALHIALDDRRAGRLAGEEFNQRGFEGNILCIIHEETNVGLEERCDGLEASYQGAVERFRTGSLAPEVRFQSIMARLNAGGVDAILALSVDSAFDVEIAMFFGQLNIPRATFGFSLGTLRRVASQRVMFTVHDHPELQSYMASGATLMVDRFRIDPSLYFNGVRVLIEPMIFGAEEMQAILDDMVADE